MPEALLPLFDTAPATDDLAMSRIQATKSERSIYDLVRPYHGHKSAISIQSLQRITGMSERTIKGVVAELVVTHKIMIGGNRSDPVGYFMIETAEDQEIAASMYRAQVLSMLKRLRVIESKHKVREFLGQQIAELGQ